MHAFILQYNCTIAERAMVAAAQLKLWNGKFLLNVKINPFSGLEEKNCMAVHQMAE